MYLLRPVSTFKFLFNTYFYVTPNRMYALFRWAFGNATRRLKCDYCGHFGKIIIAATSGQIDYLLGSNAFSRFLFPFPSYRNLYIVQIFHRIQAREFAISLGSNHWTDQRRSIFKWRTGERNETRTLKAFWWTTFLNEHFRKLWALVNS